MKVIEQFVKSKTNSQDDCEDSVFISDDFAAVIDGSTSKTTTTYNNLKPGKASALLLCKAMSSMPAHYTHEDAIVFLTSVIHDYYAGLGIVDHLVSNPVDRATASLAIYSRLRNEVWMVGDCQCIVNGVYYKNPNPIDELLSKVRSFYLNTEIIRGRKVSQLLEHDLGRAFIMPLLQRQSMFQNTDSQHEYAYGVIDGFPVPPKLIKVVKLHAPDYIVLATDGYPVLLPRLDQSEEKLALLLKKDPLCYHDFLSTKGLQTGLCSFDDRAYLKFSP